VGCRDFLETAMSDNRLDNRHFSCLVN